MGRIASLASGLDSGMTPMAREIQEFVHLVSFIAIGTGAIIFTIAMVLGYSWLNSVIFLIGVVMSYVPEGLVATIAVLDYMLLLLTRKRPCLRLFLSPLLPFRLIDLLDSNGSTNGQEAVPREKLGSGGDAGLNIRHML